MDQRAVVRIKTAQDNFLEVVPEIKMRQREKENITAALEKSGWRIYGSGGAAEFLGIKPTTLASRMKKK